MQTADAAEQAIGKGVGLAVFASDALSSTAYATQEILMLFKPGIVITNVPYHVDLDRPATDQGDAALESA